MTVRNIYTYLHLIQPIKEAQHPYQNWFDCKEEDGTGIIDSASGLNLDGVYKPNET